MLDTSIKIVVLTGSGISVESGLSTFRGLGGIWDKYDPNKVCSLSGFIHDPITAWKFNSELYLQYAIAKSNIGHKSLVKLQYYLYNGKLTIITQNIDGLHQAAGSENCIEMHGNIHRTRCNGCNYITNTNSIVCKFMSNSTTPICPICGDLLRPDVVMFEEIPKYKQAIDMDILNCDYFIQIGTSGKVRPASTLIYIAESIGAKSIILNKEKPDNITENSQFYQCNSGNDIDKYIQLLINGEI